MEQKKETAHKEQCCERLDDDPTPSVLASGDCIDVKMDRRVGRHVGQHNCSHQCMARAVHCPSRGRSSMVERQPSKLNVEGSSPFARFVDRGHFVSSHASIACMASFMICALPNMPTICMRAEIHRERLRLHV